MMPTRMSERPSAEGLAPEHGAGAARGVFQAAIAAVCIVVGSNQQTVYAQAPPARPPMAAAKPVPAKPAAPKPAAPKPAAAKPAAPGAAGGKCQVSAWNSAFVGVELATLSGVGGWRMQGYAARIDLKSPGVEFVATPGNGEAKGETWGLKTSRFLEQQKLSLAINAAPFSPVHSEEGLPQDVIGLHLAAGQLVSRPHAKHAALLISRTNRVWIAEPPLELKEAHTGVGGFWIVLKQGQIVGEAGARHPRTGAGVTGDGRHLLLVVIDGRLPFLSEGATTAELGETLLFLGCQEGINLDGGGTATLAVADRYGRARILNTPMHGGFPGNERVSGSHLGIKARPLSALASQSPP